MSHTQAPPSKTLHWADGLLLLTAFFWGINFVLIKVALLEIPIPILNPLRYLVAAFVMLGVAAALGYSLKIQRRHLWYIIIVGILGNSIYPLFFIIGLNNTTADNSALILATLPVWVAVIGTLFGTEQVDPKGWGGVTLSLIGIALVVIGSDRQVELHFGGATLWGDFMMFIAGLCWAIYTIALRPLMKDYDPVPLAGVITIIGIIPMLLWGIPDMLQFSWQTVSIAAWSSLTTAAIFPIALAYFFWGYGVAHLGSARTALYLNVVPPFTLLFAWLWLGETLTALQWVGAIVALAGVAIARQHTIQLN
ncbi:MAG: DMT family transporter [Chloroflexota bacterium]